MKNEQKQPFDWIKLVVSLFLGAVITVALVLVRAEWWYLTPYKTLRYVAIPVLWLCFSFLIWRISDRKGDSDI